MGENEVINNYKDSIGMRILIEDCTEYFGEDTSSWKFMCPCCGRIVDFEKVVELLEEEKIEVHVANIMLTFYKVHERLEKEKHEAAVEC